MKVFVTGAEGQLGCDLVKELLKRGHSVIASDIKDSSTDDCKYIQLDLTDGEMTEQVLAQEKPDAMVHCAAWTAVDLAEEEENKQAVYAVNVTATENIAKACGSLGCKLIYLSTDYVFGGSGTEPWKPECKDFAPLNQYGRTKLLGEQAVEKYTDKFFIVRISWVFGRNGGNFVKTMLKVGKNHSEVKVVNDQTGTPTYTPDLAVLLCDMLESDRYGYYHASNEGGYISWYDFTCKIYQKAGYTTKVIPVTTEEYGLSKAKRPYNSRLDKNKLKEKGFTPLPDWENALERYLKEIQDLWDK